MEMNVNDSHYKAIISSDSRVHIDIIDHCKNDWQLVREDFISIDKIILIFSKLQNGEK